MGELQGADVGIGGAEHPVCGDRVTLFVRTGAGAIADVRWRAAGCPAAMALAALAADVLPGVRLAAAADTLRTGLAARGGLARHERHAEAMVLRALAAAIDGARGG